MARPVLLAQYYLKIVTDHPAFVASNAALHALPTPTPAGCVSLDTQSAIVVTAIVTNQSLFNSLLLFGYTPIEAAVAYAASVSYLNPSAADYQHGPATFYQSTNQISFIDSTGVTVTRTILASDRSGTLTGVSYRDADGTIWTSVDWQWMGIVESYVYANYDGKFSSQVITYTGDGTAARLIATTADLSGGKSVVWIFPDSTRDPEMRHSLMNGTIGAVQPIETTNGIMTFAAGGFTITEGLTHVNENGRLYTALVLNDRGQHMAIGTYIVTAPLDGLGGSFNTGLTAMSGGVPVAAQTTMAWIFGRSGQCVLAHDLMATGFSVSLAAEAKSTTTGITALGVGSVTYGSDNNVDASAIGSYYYVAFAIPTGHAIKALMDWYKVTGTAATTDHVTGLGFTPSLAFARSAVGGIPPSVVRTPQRSAPESVTYTTASGSVVNGVVSLGSGDIGLGEGVAPNGTDCYGMAFAGGSIDAVTLPAPAWTNTTTVINPDGTTSIIQTIVSSNTQPLGGWVPSVPVVPVIQWWCNATFGWSVYQIDSPGAGWVACVGPTTANGWYFSGEGFGGEVLIASGGRPADPRSWPNIATWAAGNTGMLGGSPAGSCVIDNCTIYPASGYVVGTDYPPIRLWNGRADRELCRVPAAAGVVPKAVLSMLAAGGTTFFSTFDSGTTSADWSGRVFQLDTASGILTALGLAFAAGEMPYALAWHMGRLWCGTSNGIGTVGKIYYFRPGIDTAWTQDYDLATSTVGGALSMRSYLGKLYVGTDNAAASRGKVIVRDAAGAYTTTETGAGGTAKVNNGYPAMVVYQGNLYASYWNNDTTAISLIRKFDGTTWTTVFTGATTTLVPFNLFFEDQDALYVVGGGRALAGVIMVSQYGLAWTNLTGNLPSADAGKALLPVYGVEIQ